MLDISIDVQDERSYISISIDISISCISINVTVKQLIVLIEQYSLLEAISSWISGEGLERDLIQRSLVNIISKSLLGQNQRSFNDNQMSQTWIVLYFDVYSVYICCIIHHRPGLIHVLKT